MTSALAWGVLFGLVLGVGLWSIVSTLPRLSRPSLSLRVAPYVVDISDAARAIVDRRPASPLPVFGLVLAPLVGRLTGVTVVRRPPERRTPAAGVVASPRRLDLDDAGTEVAHHHRGVRTRESAGQVDHEDVVQRSVACHADHQPGRMKAAQTSSGPTATTIMLYVRICW